MFFNTVAYATMWNNSPFLSKYLTISKYRGRKYEIIFFFLYFSNIDILSEPIDEQDIKATVNAKQLFASCINEDAIEKRGLQPILDYINEELSGWPILNSSTQYNITVIDRLIRLKKVDSSQLFECFVSTDPKNPKKNVLRVKFWNFPFNLHMFSF